MVIYVEGHALFQKPVENRGAGELVVGELLRLDELLEHVARFGFHLAVVTVVRIVGHGDLF